MWRSESMAQRPPPLLGHLLRVVSVPHWREHRVRTVLTVIGIALGVATVAAVSDISASVLAAFRRVVQTVSANGDLEIVSASGGVDESLVQRAVAVPGVGAAAGLVEGFVPLADHPGQTAYVLGIDFLGSPIWQVQIPREAAHLTSEMAFVSHADSVAVAGPFADRLGLRRDDALRVVTPGGVQSLTVRGLLDAVALARLFDGALLVMDLPAAQLLLDRGERVDRIVVELADGAPEADVRAALAAALGPSVQVIAPDVRGEHGERLLASLRTMLMTVSAMAVIVGAFIVYHTVAFSLHQRRREFAVLNVVGVERRSLFALCGLETALLAACGVGLGLLGGSLAGGFTARLVAESASEIWVRVDVTEHVFSTPGALVAAAVGLFTAGLATALAVRATFRAPTVEALRPASVELERSPHLGRTTTLGCALVLAPWVLVAAPHALGVGTLVALIVGTYASAYAGGAILAGPLLRVVARATQRWAPHAPALPLRLSAANLPRGAQRSSATVATLTVTIAMAVLVAGLVQSFHTTVLGWVEDHFAADLFVGSGTRVRLIAGMPMQEDLGARLAAIPGVAAVEPTRVFPIEVNGFPVFLQGISLDHRLARGGVTIVEGSLEAAAPELRAGTGILVSDNLAYKLGVHTGDRIEVPTPAGARSFRIAGTFIDYLASLDLGAVTVDRAQLKQVWGDDVVSLYRLWVHPTASPSRVGEAVRAELGPGYYALTAREFLDGIHSVLRSFFVATWALQLVAALVGAIGVLNAQVATLLDRAEEVRTLRTVGLSSRDVTRSVLIECGALGLLGGLAGVALGAVLSANFVGPVMRLVVGGALPLELDPAPMAVAALAAGLLAAVAGYVPAHAAAALGPSEGRSE